MTEEEKLVHGLQESLILRCPVGASKDEAGVPAFDKCKKRR